MREAGNGKAGNNAGDVDAKLGVSMAGTSGEPLVLSSRLGCTTESRGESEAGGGWEEAGVEHRTFRIPQLLKKIKKSSSSSRETVASRDDVWDERHSVWGQPHSCQSCAPLVRPSDITSRLRLLAPVGSYCERAAPISAIT